MNHAQWLTQILSRLKFYLGSRSFTAASYFLGLFIQRFAYLLLIPVLVARFNGEDFSRYGLLQSFLLLAPVVLTLRVHVALGRLIYDKQPAEKARLLGTSLLSGVLPVVGFIAVVLVCNWWFPLADPITRGALWMILAVGVMLVSRVISEFGSILFRAEGDGPRFLLLSAIEGGSFLVLISWVLGFHVTSFEQLVIGISVASAITSLLCLATLRRSVPLGQFDWSIFCECLNYSWPTAVHVLGWWLCNQSARWIGTSQIGLEEMAGFSLVLIIVNVIGLVTRTIFEMERPNVGKKFSSSEWISGNQLLMRCRRDAVVAAIGLSVVAVGFYQFLGQALPEAYRFSTPLMVLIAVYLVVDAFSLKSTNLLLAMKMSRALSVASLLGGAISLMTAYLLCQFLGLTGLCVSLTIAIFVQAGLSEWLSGKALRAFVTSNQATTRLVVS